MADLLPAPELPSPAAPTKTRVDEISLAVVDDHAAVRAGLVAHVQRASPIHRIAEFASLAELRDSGARPDVIILDLWLTEGSSTPAIPALIADGARVLLYTSEERPVPLRQAVAAGAHGLLLKNDPLELLVPGIEAVARGEFHCGGAMAHALLTSDKVARFSPRQTEILNALSDGHDYRGVARRLEISVGALKTQLGRIREKFRGVGVDPNNSIDMIRLAREQGDLD